MRTILTDPDRFFSQWTETGSAIEPTMVVPSTGVVSLVASLQTLWLLSASIQDVEAIIVVPVVAALLTQLLSVFDQWFVYSAVLQATREDRMTGGRRRVTDGAR